MNAYIIHIKGNENSEKTADLALVSCQEHGYEPELVNGITPHTIHFWDETFKLDVLKPSHMYDRQTGLNGSRRAYEAKYSNFLNHYRLWLKCIELDENIVILEHDVIATSSLDHEFDELLLLNAKSGLWQEQFRKINKPDLKKGVHNYENPYLYYRSANHWQNSGMIPGTAAYAISPKGAYRLAKNVRKSGWDKADYIINTKSVHMQYIEPEVFTLSHHIVPNQRTSHG